MKKNNLLILALCVIVFCACDSNKSKVKDLANQFVSAYNDGDKATVYDLFPAIKSYANLAMSGAIGQGDEVSIEKIDSTGNYIATINEQKQQRLVFAVDSVGGIQMIDSYGVFRLDSVANELALKAGVPVKSLSDIEKSKLMNPEGDFISDLKLSKNTDFLWASYGAYSWSRNSSGCSVSMDFTVRNNSSQTVNGKDYYLVVTPQQKSTGTVYHSKTIDGVDIAPNEIREFNAVEPPLYNIASQRDLSYKVEIKYRSESTLAFLLNYGKFEGNEYDDYLAHPYRAKVKSQGSFGVVNAEKDGVAYAYKEMSEKSEVIDTLYHRKGIQVVWESDSWTSIYNYDDELIGYMKSEFIDTSRDVPELDLTNMTLKSDNGKVNVYDCSDEALTDKVIKTIPANQKVLLEIMEGRDFFLYERQPNGSVKMIGRISSENVVFDEE